eukprot:scaffold6337_cov256-Alexandrium_tamarense.AAC.1
MSAADDQNTAITTPERRNNSGILPSDAGRPAGWGWGSAIRSLVTNNPTTPTTPQPSSITTSATSATTATTTQPAATTEAGHFTGSPSMTSLVADAATSFVMSLSDVLSLPDDQCKAKAVYVKHNRSFKVLVAMSRGLVDDAGELLFDENVEPWCKLNPREWQASRDKLAAEITSRWEDYVANVDGKPRPKQWKKPAMLEWLMNNPIATLGDGDGTTRDADCMFLGYQMGEMKKLRTDAIEALAQQQTLLEGNWVGPDPIIPTPEKCESKFNAVVLNLRRIITMWERSWQGEGGFLHEEEEAQMGLVDFGSLAGRSDNALSNRANFVGEKDNHFLYLWDLIDKYDLLKTCMQVISPEFAAASGDNVRVIYNSKRAQLKEDEDDDTSSMSSKQPKSEMANFGGGLMKLAYNNVMIAKMQAQEQEKDRQEKEKDRLAAEELHKKQIIEREKDHILQQKQSLETESIETG